METNQGPFLLRDEKSGRYYARFYRDGKEVWRSLKTDVIGVAKYRLAEELKRFRSVAMAAKTVESGKGTVEKLEQLYLVKVQNNPSLKASTRLDYVNLVKAIFKSWPELKTAKPEDISKADCEAWAKRYSDQYCGTRYNNAVDTLRKVFDIALEQGILYRNPATGLARRTLTRKLPELPTTEEV